MKRNSARSRKRPTRRRRASASSSNNFHAASRTFRIIRRMRMRLGIITLSVVAMTLSAAPPGVPAADVFTPLTMSAFTPRTIAFPGTDGRTHIVYELLLTNTNVTPATVETVEVLDTANPSNVLDTYDAKKLLTAL